MGAIIGLNLFSVALMQWTGEQLFKLLSSIALSRILIFLS